MDHLQLVLVTVAISFAICVVLFIISRKYHKVGDVVMVIVNMIYTIPSMALFALMVPVVGIGRPAAYTALTLYNLFVILKNMNVGFDTISPLVLEAATGIGYDNRQRLLKIELPLAMPSIFAGLKLASTMNVGLATIAKVVNGGGLGDLLFDGLKRRYLPEIIWATLACILMSVVLNFIFQSLENWSLDRAQGFGKTKARKVRSGEPEQAEA